MSLSSSILAAVFQKQGQFFNASGNVVLKQTEIACGVAAWLEGLLHYDEALMKGCDRFCNQFYEDELDSINF